MEAVTSTRDALSIVEACNALGASRASFYRRQTRIAKPHRDPEATEIITSRASSPRALTPAERRHVLDLVHEPRFVDKPVPQVWASLIDEGQYLCSMRTMYRILDAHREVRERRNLLRRPSYAKPELLATGPNQVWSWDITKLAGPRKWTYFNLYVVLDVFSRYAVGWMVATRESAGLATKLVEEAARKQGITPGQLTLHADRGAPMISKSLALLLADLGVHKSHSRPSVSDDNPFSESQFKTAKYRPDYPDRFPTVQDARHHFKDFFDWYHHEHHHSSLAWLTPAQVHFGHADQITTQRSLVLDQAYQRHPERFVRRPPSPPTLEKEVWINPPAPPC